jgi:hypothetical protein
MVNYAEEARQLAAENQRRMSLLLDEIQAINEQTAATGRELVDRLTADMDEFWTTHADELGEAAAEAEARQRLQDEAREQRGGHPPHNCAPPGARIWCPTHYLGPHAGPVRW